MAGVKGRSGRPGGNPDIVQHKFKTDRPESLLKQLQLRISESMWAELQKQDDWREFVREAIATALEKQHAEDSARATDKDDLSQDH